MQIRDSIMLQETQRMTTGYGTAESRAFLQVKMIKILTL
jgi:hypothetical protein